MRILLYLKTILTIVWSSIRCPLSTTVVDLTNGDIVNSELMLGKVIQDYDSAYKCLVKVTDKTSVRMLLPKKLFKSAYIRNGSRFLMDSISCVIKLEEDITDPKELKLLHSEICEP